MSHVRIENDLFQAIMICDFSKRQLKIINLIYRLSVGCQREWARIPQRKDFEAVGITQNHIKHEIGWLMNTRVVLNEGELYKINPTFSDWAISPVKTYEPTQLNELISLNLLTSQNGKPELPKTGSEGGQTSQNGKPELPKKGSDADTKLATAKHNVQTVCVFNIDSIQHTQLTDLYKTLHKFITPQIVLDILKYAQKYGFKEVEFAIKESGRQGGRSSNYMLGILENRAVAGKGTEDRVAAAPAQINLNDDLKKISAPDISPYEIWHGALDIIKSDISRTGYETLFSECCAVRWDGCCLILRPPRGVSDDAYQHVYSKIRGALIKVLDSEDVDFEFEREVEHAI